MLFLITVSNFITRLYQVLCSQQIYIDGDEPSFLMFDSGSEIAGDMYHYISFDCHGPVRRNCLAYPQDLSQHGTIDTIVLRYRRDIIFCQALCFCIRHDYLRARHSGTDVET